MFCLYELFEYSATETEKGLSLSLRFPASTLVEQKDGGIFERKRGKVAGLPGGYPLPDGGYEKFFQMTVAQKAKLRLGRKKRLLGLA
jgi:hypothetical protein